MLVSARQKPFGNTKRKKMITHGTTKYSVCIDLFEIPSVAEEDDQK